MLRGLLSFGAAIRLGLLPHTASRRQGPGRLATAYPACSCLQLAVASNWPRKGLTPPIQCPCQAHLPPGRPGNGTPWQPAESPPKKRAPLSEQTRPPLISAIGGSCLKAGRGKPSLSDGRPLRPIGRSYRGSGFVQSAVANWQRGWAWCHDRIRAAARTGWAASLRGPIFGQLAMSERVLVSGGVNP